MGRSGRGTCHQNRTERGVPGRVGTRHRGVKVPIRHLRGEIAARLFNAGERGAHADLDSLVGWQIERYKRSWPACRRTLLKRPVMAKRTRPGTTHFESMIELDDDVAGESRRPIGASVEAIDGVFPRDLLPNRVDANQAIPQAQIILDRYPACFCPRRETETHHPRPLRTGKVGVNPAVGKVDGVEVRAGMFMGVREGG